MLTKKLLVAVGLAGALVLSVAAPAEARGWGGGGFHRGPAGGHGYGGPVYRGPVYGGPVYRGPVYGGPVYGGPVYRGVDWRRLEWLRMHGRFGYRY